MLIYTRFVELIFDQDYLKNIELISNTYFLEYTIGCTVCLEVCLINKKNFKISRNRIIIFSTFDNSY
jgi:hypothetical protein